MNKLLRFFFLRYKTQVYELMVEDLYGSIPKKISETGVRILSKDRVAIERWFYWMSLQLQRQMAANPKNGQQIMGMMLQVKIILSLLTGGAVDTVESEGASPAAKARADREQTERDSHKKQMEGVARFKNRGVPLAEKVE